MPPKLPPGTSARPMSKGGRLATSLQRPPTGSRLGTARMGTARPGSKYGAPPGTGALSSSVQVANRPMTQQGLSGVKTGGLGPQRQVQDASYYSGVLRTKIKELQDEILKMEKESGALNAENATYLTFERRAENLAQQLKDKQGELADYNLLIDKLNTNTDVEEIADDCAELQRQNNRESKGVEILFGEKHEKEVDAAKIEAEIGRQRETTNELLSQLDNETQNKYMSLKEASFNLQQSAERLQSEVDSLSEKENMLQSELQSTPLKLRAFEISARISELADKRNTLQAEIKSEEQLSPEEEKQKHLKQVREDNQEIAGFESQIKEIKAKIEHCQDDIARCEESMMEQDSEQAKKYKELRKREEQIEEYLGKFNSQYEEELEHTSIHEDNIVKLLEAISTGLSRAKMLPSVRDFKELKEDLEFKATEADRAQVTLENLTTDKEKLRQDFAKLEQLEQKINSEMVNIKEKMLAMNEDLEIFCDIDKLVSDMEDKRASLMEEKEEILSNRDTSKANLSEMEKEHKRLKRSIEDNETYIQLSNLERKWQFIEQNNSALKDAIAKKTDESNYDPIKAAVAERVGEINKMIQEQLTIQATQSN